MSGETKERESWLLDDLSIKRLRIFEDHIKGKIREAIEREVFFDPRDDEMMGEIYPNG